MKPIYSTLLHILELAIIIGLVYLMTWLFPGYISNEAIQGVLVLVLAGLAKFVRVSPKLPIDDYVNKP